jgi:hypothetical protein
MGANTPARLTWGVKMQRAALPYFWAECPKVEEPLDPLRDVGTCGLGAEHPELSSRDPLGQPHSRGGGHRTSGHVGPYGR